MKTPIQLCSITLACFGLPASSHAALLAYEGFDSSQFNTGASGTGADFSTDDLRSQGAGSGLGFTSNWANPTINGTDPGGGTDYWSNTDNSAATAYYRASTGQTGYTDGAGSSLMTTSGQAFFTTTDAANPQVSLERSYATGLRPGNDFFYASALLTIDGTNHALVGLASTSGTTTSATRPFQFGFNAAGNLVAAGNINKSIDDRDVGVSTASYSPGTYFLVAKFSDVDTENDNIEIWVNPTLGAAGEMATPDYVYDDPAVSSSGHNFAVFDNGSWRVQGIVLDSGDDANGTTGFDEIRFGESFADVTPFVPEPSSTLLLTISAISLLSIRRRV